MFFFCAALYAQQSVVVRPDCRMSFSLTSTNLTGNTLNNQTPGLGCNSWAVTYSNDTFTGLTLTFQSAPSAGVDSPGTFVSYAGTVLTGTAAMTSITQTTSTFRGFFPFVRMLLSGLTGSGTVRGTIIGWYVPPDQTVAISGTVGPTGAATAQADNATNTPTVPTTGATPLTNIMYGYLFDGATWDRMPGNTAGTYVQGPAADQAAIVGNPVVIAGDNNSGSVQRFRTTNGDFIVNNTASAAADGQSNTLRTPANVNGVQIDVREFPFVFNGSAWDRQFACTNQLPVTLTASGNTQIIPLSGSTTIRICHFSVSAASAVRIKFTRGTGADCATGTADVTEFYEAATSFVFDFSPASALRGAASGAICINQASAVVTGGVVIYAQF
jgi:hypothetical protein